MTKETHCTTYGVPYGTIVEKNEDSAKDLYSWYSDPDDQDHIRREIDNITEFLKSNYKLIDENIEISTTEKVPTSPIIGIRYELDDVRLLVGEVFIVFMRDFKKGMTYPYYIYRAEVSKIPVDKIPCDCVYVYMKFRETVIELSDALGSEGINVDKNLFREDIYTEPTFYQRQEKIDVNSFKQFIKNMSYIGTIFPLRVTKMRWYSSGQKGCI